LSRRRKQQSLFEEFAEPFQHLPAPVGIGVAAVLVLAGWFATLFHTTSLVATLLLMFAPWFMWLLALAVVISTLGGAFRRVSDGRRFDRTEDVQELDPYQFERYIGEYYRRRGWLVTQRGGRGGDGGVDLVIEDRDERLIVQCKHWKAWKVGVQPLRELWGIVAHERATGAIFVTSGRYTNEACAFAEGKDLSLIDGDRLKQMISEVRGAAATVPSPPAPATGRTCPSCGATMVVRIAHRGPHAGEEFWGCSAFPRCRQTLPIAVQKPA
jgi:restriction system protein